MSLIREGRVWLFGDDVNTDLIFPNRAFRLPLAEQHRMVFSANRPGWVDQVQPGDLIVAGDNFAMGSGRPVGRLLRECGVAGVLARSINGLGLRNCITFGFPALAAPGVTDWFAEGERARCEFSRSLEASVAGRPRSRKSQRGSSPALSVRGTGRNSPATTRTALGQAPGSRP